MPASAKLIPAPLLSLLLTAALCLAPGAQAAKKDLFGSEPASHQTLPAPQTLNEQNTDQTAEQNAADIASAQEQASAPAPAPDKLSVTEHKDKPTGLEKQWERLKSGLSNTKKDLFGDKPKQSNPARPAQALVQEQEVASSEVTSSSSSIDNRPLISATEAAQRAQRKAEGQVMNVRKVQDDGKTLYNVNLLQKNGRMKTVNIDAHSGDVVEEATP